MVEEDPYNLKYINNQTEEMCLVAVRQDGWVLQYVKEQTEEMCFIAVQQYVDSYCFIKDSQAYVRYLEDNNLFATEVLRNNQDYRNFLMKYRSKQTA